MVNIRSVERAAYDKYTDAKWFCFGLTRGNSTETPLLDDKADTFPEMNVGREKAICERELWGLHCKYIECMNQVEALGKARKTRNERITILEKFTRSAEETVQIWTERYHMTSFDIVSHELHQRTGRKGDDGFGFSQAL